MANFLSPINFQVAIKRLSGMTFNTKRASVPGISIASVKIPSPLNKYNQFGDETEFENLSITFMVDEDLDNYTTIMDWMLGGTTPNSGDEFDKLKKSDDGVYSDISIIIEDSNKNPSIVINFENCFPISLSEIALDTSSQSLEYAECTVSFEYDTFNVVTT